MDAYVLGLTVGRFEKSASPALTRLGTRLLKWLALKRVAATTTAALHPRTAKGALEASKWLAAGAIANPMTEAEYRGGLFGLVAKPEEGKKIHEGEKLLAKLLNAVSLRYAPGAFRSGKGPIANLKRVAALGGVVGSTPLVRSAQGIRDQNARAAILMEKLTNTNQALLNVATGLDRANTTLSKTRDAETKINELLGNVNTATEKIKGVPWGKVGYGAAGVGGLYGLSKVYDLVQARKKKKDEVQKFTPEQIRVVMSALR
jgi:hypothetical protein